MRSIIIQIIIVISVTQIFGQTVYPGLNVPYDPCNPCSGSNITYGATAYFNQPNQVASDFGPRDLAKTYWHGGIDFNTSPGAGEAQRWYMIVSPQVGIIADYDHLTHAVAAYKYGLVNITDDEGNGSHTWLFGHVFDKDAQYYHIVAH